MLVASNAPSDPPRLALTSVFLHRCRMPRCRQFPNSEKENLAWNPAPRNPLLLQATLVAHSNHGLCSFLLANGMWLLECGCWNAQCDGLQALVFLLSCSLEELCWTSIQDGWINGWIDGWTNGSMDQWTNMEYQPWLLAAGIRVDASWRRGVLLRARPALPVQQHTSPIGPSTRTYIDSLRVHRFFLP